jgi:uncharacterized protein YegP (UPF0339 family)
MSGHRSFADLFSGLPADRRRRIEAEVEASLSRLDRDGTAEQQESKFVIYRGSDGLLRWRLVAASGQTLADSAQAFSTRSECLDSIDRLRMASSTLAVEEAA